MKTLQTTLALLALGWCGSAGGQTAAPDTLFVAATVQPAVVTIGERVTVEFSVALPESGARLVGPPAPVTFGPVDVLVSEAAPTGPDSSGWSLEVAFFETGDHDLSTIPFMMEWEDTVRSLRLLPYSVSVESVLPDTLANATIRDITGLAPVPLRWRWGRIAVALALLAGAVALVMWYRRRPRETAPVSVLRPEIPPEEAALLALRELADEGLPQRGLHKEHYFRLSLILRAYMERRLAMTALESTTAEIRENLEASPVRPETRAAVLEILEEADLVKFARVDTGASAADKALDAGTRWVTAVGAWVGEEGRADDGGVP